MKSRTPNIKKIYLLLSIILYSLDSSASTTVYLKFFIEGYLDGSPGMQPVKMNQGCPPPNSSVVTAEVTVELRAAAAPYNLIEATPATLMTNGLCTATFVGTFTGSYFIAIKHCNTLETWSALPVPISLLSSSQPYDFSTSLAQAYDDDLNDDVPCMVQSPYNYTPPNTFALFSGDVNQDGNISLADLAQIQNDIMNFSFGCVCTDINGDGNGDILDTPIPEANLFQWMKRPY